MTEENKKEETAPKSCEECERWLEIKQKMRVSQLLTQTVNGIEAQLRDKSLKPTLGDYLKLLQLERELDEEEAPKEIKVTWVDPATLSEPVK